MNTVPHKTCTKCGTTYPLSFDYFYRQSRNKSGFRSECRSCTSAAASMYNRSPRGREVMQTAERKYCSTDYGREAKRQKASRYRDNNPNKEQARKAVSHAVRCGILPRVSTCACSDCGGQAETYHHPSYQPDHWLDVIPVCRKCHRKIHT